jgi:carbamoyl-phosphate synthase large subunit
MAGKSLERLDFTEVVVPEYFSVKEAVFPFNKFPDVDPILGPEMKSTGEVMGVGATFAEAFAKGHLAAGEHLPQTGIALISVRDEDKGAAIELARVLSGSGFSLYATTGTAAALAAHSIPVKRVNKVIEARPDVIDLIKNSEVSLVINTASGRQAIADSYMIRRSALQHKIPYCTTIAGAEAVVAAISFGAEKQVRRLQDLH